jgi:hypothetical protein
VISFLNCTKYPPSLAFLLMTLGPALVFLGMVDRWRLAERNPLMVFGRAPPLFLVAHLPVIHALAIALTASRYGAARNLYPADYGWDLWVVYAIWLVVLALMYPLCLWFVRLRQRRRSLLLSYL